MNSYKNLRTIFAKPSKAKAYKIKSSWDLKTESSVAFERTLLNGDLKGFSI